MILVSLSRTYHDVNVIMQSMAVRIPHVSEVDLHITVQYISTRSTCHYLDMILMSSSTCHYDASPDPLHLYTVSDSVTVGRCKLSVTP